MEHKQTIETLLDSLKSKGLTRRIIEKKLGYSENYLDQQLVKGGNKRLLKALQDLDSKVLEKATTDVNEPQAKYGAKEPLETAIENLSISKVIDSRNMERLILLLQAKLGTLPDMPGFSQPGTKGTETGTKKANSGAK